MMKYWLFQNNQVLGPFDREEMAQVKGFSADSLVCPEGRRGTEMGDWQRAGVVAELAEALLKTARVAAMARAGPPEAVASLPPEPTLRDLASLGTLQEKTAVLENAFAQMQEDLRLRDGDLSRLKVDLAQKERALSEQQTRITELEAKLVAISSLKPELEFAREKLVAHEHEVRELRSQLQRAQDDLRGDISKTADDERASEAKLAETRLKLDEVQRELSRTGEAEAADKARLEEQERLIRELKAKMETTAKTPPPMIAPPPGSSMAPPPASFAPPPNPFGTPETSAAPASPLSGGLQIERFDMMPMDLGPAPGPATAPPPAFPGGAEIMDLTGGPASPAPAGAPSPLQAIAEGPPGAKAPSKKGGLFLKIVVPIALLVPGLLYFGGGKLFHAPKKAVPAPPPLPPPAPPPDPLPPPPPPPPDPTMAVEFAKSFAIPASGRKLSEVLESAFPQKPGGVNWMVDREGDDRFAVQFYSGTKPEIVYKFLVQPQAGVVLGNNPPARAVLGGEVPKAPAAPKKKKKAKKAEAGLGDTLIIPDDEAPPEPAESQAEPAEGEGAEEQSTGPAETAPKPAKARGRKKAAKEPEMDLDQLLLPGAPKADSSAKPQGTERSRAPQDAFPLE